MEHGGDLLDELIADHQDIQVHFSELAGIPLGDPERKRIADLVTELLMRHAVGEEEQLYPLARARLADGEEIVAQELADHRGIEALLGDLHLTSATANHFDRLLARVVEEATRHAGEEEAQLFPALRLAASPEELRILGDRVRESKVFASGRPRRLPAADRPEDRLVPPERSLRERVRTFLTPRAMG